MKKLFVFVLALSAVLCGCYYKPEQPKTAYDHTYETVAQETVYQDEEIETLNSSAFISIGYRPSEMELWVVFRNTGALYHYYDVPYEVWCAFKTADSKGSYFQESIRGYYEYDRN